MAMRGASVATAAGVMAIGSTAPGRHFPAVRHSMLRYVRRCQAPLPLRILSKGLAAVVGVTFVLVVALGVAQRLGFQADAIVPGPLSSTVSDGSLVIADTNVPCGKGLVGNVAAFNVDGSVTARPVVDVAEDGLVVQGGADGEAGTCVVGASDYVGLVRLAVPGMGVALAMLRTAGGVILLAALALAAIALRRAERHWHRRQVMLAHV